LTQEARVQNAFVDVARTIRHGIGCHLTREARVQIANDDVVSTIHQSLIRGSSLVMQVEQALGVGSGALRGHGDQIQTMAKRVK
jgi:hypothetical protein